MSWENLADFCRVRTVQSFSFINKFSFFGNHSFFTSPFMYELHLKKENVEIKSAFTNDKQT